MCQNRQTDGQTQWVFQYFPSRAFGASGDKNRMGIEEMQHKATYVIIFMNQALYTMNI